MTLYMANVEYFIVLQAVASFCSVFVSLRYYCTLLLLLEGARASTGLCVDVGSGVMI